MGSAAIGNLKGGVGKTTVTVNLGVALVRQLRKHTPSARVLIADMDTQAWATALLTGDDPRKMRRTIATMLAGLTEPDETLVHIDELPGLDDRARHAWAGIDLIPSNPEAKVLVSGASDYWALRELLTDWRPPNVEWTLFDCGYGDTDSFTLAVAAADDVLGVTSGSEGGLQGLRELERKLSKLRQSFPHVQELAGVIANNFDLRQGPDRAILADLEEQLGSRLWTPTLPKRAAVERAHGARLPLAALPEEGARELTAIYDQLAHTLLATEAHAA